MNQSLGFCHVIIMWPLFQIDTRYVTMTRDVPASETFVNMPVARPRDMRFSRNSRLRKRRGHGTITTDWTPETWILDYNGWIPDSKALDSGFHRAKLPGFRIPDYLTWSDKSVVLLERLFARGIWVTRKPNCLFLFFLRKLDVLS